MVIEFKKQPLQTLRMGIFFGKHPYRRLGGRFFTKNDENHSSFSAPLHPRTACNKRQAAGNAFHSSLPLHKRIIGI